MRLRPSFPIATAVVLLAVAPAIASSGSSPNSGPDKGGSINKTITSVTTTTTTVVTGVVGNGANGAVSAPGQGLLPDNAVTITTPAGENTSPPVVGQRLGVTPEGTVSVQAPGGAQQDLSDGATVPTGTTIDASQGTVTLTAAVDAAGTQQSAEFSGGKFTVVQVAGPHPVTKLVMSGGDFSSCPKAPATASRLMPVGAFAAKARKPVRSLFGSGHGSFRTQGRFAAATVRGTIWQTDDYCDRTVITVKRGLVAVRDLHSGRTVNVPAGHGRTIRRR
jgi:hypothetical protein